MALYEPLPTDCVRLLRLLPYSDEHPGIRCELISCAILQSSRTHPYEALSYVWGPEDGQSSIRIGSRQVSIRGNLYAALSHLQDAFVERILWIDAICINQEDTNEKGLQVQSMAKIYAKASRVIVWLGEETGQGSHALKTLRIAAEEKENGHPVSESDQQPVYALLCHSWFQRIWVLQEVAAARSVLIKCGHLEMEGYTFFSGINALNLTYEANYHLLGIVPPISNLIRGSIFRSRPEAYDTKNSGRFYLNIAPLSELVDMYHLRKATEPHDKVFALLGMRSDGLSADEIPVSYNSPWKDLFQEVVQSFVSDHQKVITWEEMAIIQGKGRVLGDVESVEQCSVQHGRQVVLFHWGTRPRPAHEALWTLVRPMGLNQFVFQASARPIQVGDVVCLLEGTTAPAIVRVFDGTLIVIRISVSQLSAVEYLWPSITSFPEDMILVWDWSTAVRHTDYRDLYEQVLRNGMFHSKEERCQCRDDMERAARLFNTGMVLSALWRTSEAWEAFERSIENRKNVLTSSDVDAVCATHVAWIEANKLALHILDAMLFASANMRTWSCEPPMAWAVDTGIEPLARALLMRDYFPVDYLDTNGRVMLERAAIVGRTGIVCLLTDMGAPVDGDDWHSTPLSSAALNGHEALVRLLLDRGAKVNGQMRRVPLHLAIQQGHDAIVRLLLDRGAQVNGSKYEDVPLTLAARAGWETMVRLLLDRGAKVDYYETRIWPLVAAAKEGHEAIVRLLLDSGAKVDASERESKNKELPLQAAAGNGHNTIVQMLLDRGAQIEATQLLYRGTPKTALDMAVEGQCETTVRLLLDRGACADGS